MSNQSENPNPTSCSTKITLNIYLRQWTVWGRRSCGHEVLHCQAVLLWRKQQQRHQWHRHHRDPSSKRGKPTCSPCSSPTTRNISRSRPIIKRWSSTSKSCWGTWCLKNSTNLYSPRTTSTSRRPWISSAGPWLMQFRTRVSIMFASSLVWRVISSRERRRSFARSLLGLLRV